ncbi:MAG: galactose-1-epimerase [Planctomycetota bacterium]|nr:MAG: galactose-1-epimerase [Planctomycetota bacterium]
MRNRNVVILLFFVAFFMPGCCKCQKPGGTKMDITKDSYGKTADGKAVDLYTLTNANGLVAKVTNYGAIVTELWVPDRNGNLGDVVQGYDTLDGYIQDTAHFGAIVGRVGNRTANGKFTLDGVEYTLAKNERGVNHLHGGTIGFDKVVWDASQVRAADAVGVKLTYLSKDGEEGYPGNLTCTVTYYLTNDDELKIEYEVTTDKPTVHNVTHHGYFNLAGEGSGDILSHELMIDAASITPVDENLIPTGELMPVAGTPFDFNQSTAIGARINQDDEQLKFGRGYDHNWVLNNYDGSCRKVCVLYNPKSGRVMETHTTEPGLQFYSGNFLDGTITGKGGKVYEHRYALCLETQHFPDSANHPQFPSIVLRPGETYKSTTVFKFSTK